MNIANTDRLTKELQKFQGLDEELAILQEDFLHMEQKWLAEQKRKKYFEEQAAKEERKAREMSEQLYMIMTNELTPASFKVSVKFYSRFKTNIGALISRTRTRATCLMCMQGGWYHLPYSLIIRL